jgi:AraC family transcriptional regulator, regulatory protein of adaptative response / DNA-3-methyladenine glycosylase II
MNCPEPSPPHIRRTGPQSLDAVRCYKAMADRDAAWDGIFFTGVTSTGIYCRPVCRVKLPRATNCLFFETSAQAESHGFRPCLRCRPELAPARRFWSTTDAGTVLAEFAAKHLHTAIQRGLQAPTMTTLATQLGVSDRHLRRMFTLHWHVSPVQYMQTQRLLRAKQWLYDSPLSVAQVAKASGFRSTRRMYAAFAQHYQLSPAQLRPTRNQRQTNSSHSASLKLVLHYRPPCQIGALWQFFKDRSLPSIESWQGEGPHAVLRRTVRWPHEQDVICGWIEVQWDTERPWLHLGVSPNLLPVLPDLVAQVRDWLDLDAEPAAVAQVIGPDFPNASGQRLPGGLDGFELAVRAILGQQITVKAARTLGQRLVNALGAPCETPWLELNRTFPSAATLALEENAAVMGSLGVVRQRQKAIQGLARAVESDALQLHAQAPLEPTLQALLALPGIGPWTAHYIAMRALRWLDAWPVQDVALQTALGVRQHPTPTKAVAQLGLAWQPFRSYALIAAWQRLHTTPEAPL